MQLSTLLPACKPCLFYYTVDACMSLLKLLSECEDIAGTYGAGSRGIRRIQAPI